MQKSKAGAFVRLPLLCSNTVTKSILERKGHISSFISSQSVTEESQDRNLEAGSEAEAMGE